MNREALFVGLFPVALAAVLVGIGLAGSHLPPSAKRQLGKLLLVVYAVLLGVLGAFWIDQGEFFTFSGLLAACFSLASLLALKHLLWPSSPTDSAR